MTVNFWCDDRDDKVFFVKLANPPVNAINLAVRQGLHDAILAIQAATGLERVVLMGSETIFAAGGDAREFDAPPIAPHLPDVLARTSGRCGAIGGASNSRASPPAAKIVSLPISTTRSRPVAA